MVDTSDGVRRATPLGDVRRPATIYDVARAAGVSHQTVSRFLKGYPGIRPHTRERVVEALDRLDYRPNLTARSLTTGRSHRLGALTHEISQFGPSRTAEGASAAARESGYLLDVVTLDVHDPASIDQSLTLLAQHDLAGILALASTDEMTEAFTNTEFRVPVFISTEADDALHGHPSQFTEIGMPALIGHLTDLGHREFLHLAGPMTWPAARNRVRAFSSTVESFGLHSAGILHGDWSARSGYEAVMTAAHPLRATAVVAANDQMALGAVLALTERGYRVPEDVSVAGIDDIPEAAYYRPPLTTLRMNFADQGRTAVDQLIARIEGTDPPEMTVPPSQLIVRSSTGPVRALGGRPATPA